MPALAMTDHGVMYGAIDFYKACKKAGVKPIIGCEVYVAPRGRLQKEPKLDEGPFHLILLAQDQEGYRNLVRLCSLASIEGFYYRPRIDVDLLAAHAKGLIALTSCLGGVLNKRFLRDQEQEAHRAARQYLEIFGRDNLFFELQNHGIPEQARVNAQLIPLARELGVGLVATNDIHYLRAEDAQAHDVLVCIQTGKTVHDRDRMRYPGGQFYMKSPEEMAEAMRDYPEEALTNTVAIAERCHVAFQFGQIYLPHYELPQGYDATTYLRRLCEERLPARYPEAAGGQPAPEVAERLAYELGVIEKMGYPGYFLIVSDFIEHARKKGIAVGPGRGSAAGSLVAYVLGITGLDPLRYNLLFERFLNPERVTMPDMDIDFDDRRRGEVIDYVVERYGTERVAQIITFGRMLARAVIRDVGRALGISYGEVDRIAKMVPATLGMTLERALEVSPELKDIYTQRPDVKNLIDLAQRLEGLPRHASVHAAGVVIARDPLMDHVPLQRMPDGTIVTQFPMNIMEELGLLKFDFLGLRTLSVIEEAGRLARDLTGEPFDPYAVSLEDVAAYQLMGQGQTAGIFQLESSGMRDMLKDLRPTCLEDIIAAVALYRPGPMENIPEFVRSKHEGGIRYPHPALEPILKDTYGIMVYQEQIMQVAATMAGFSLGQADILRRAVSKKKKEVLDAQREVFVAGCLQQGHPERLANELYDLIVKFANYGFNKCLTGDTLVTDYDTGEMVAIGELHRQGRLVATPSLGEDGGLRRGRVTDVIYNGVKPIYRLTTASGRTIRATATHRFLKFDGWAELHDLRAGDRIAVPRRLPATAGERWPRHRLALLGYILAEGNTCHPVSFYFYTKDERELADYLSNLERFENTVGRVDRSKPAMAVYAKRIERCRPSEAVTWFQSLGLWGYGARQKHVPAAAFRLHPDDLAVLVGKMWVGDGCVDAAGAQVYYATSSEVLARQLQHILLRLGLTGTIHHKTFLYRGGTRDGYTVHLSGYQNLRRFGEAVGPHLVGRARDRWEEMRSRHPYLEGEAPRTLARGTPDTVPAQVLSLVRHDMAAAGRTARDVAVACGLSERLLGFDARKKGFRRETLAVLADELSSPALARHAHSDILWDEVVSMEFAGLEDTYDITVDQDHNFVAGDIIVHNSHAAAYALLSYITAYLKAKFPDQFMAALLTSVRDNADKVAEYIQECGRMDIPVLPPDVNESQSDFTVVGNRIRFGLAAVKNVGLGAVEAIVAARAEGGPYTSLVDFCERADVRQVNKRALESLIKAGAMDSFGARRAQLLAVLEQAMQRAQESQAQKSIGQFSLFDALGGGGPAPAVVDLALPDVEEFSQKELLGMEKEILGLYISGHPMSGREEELARATSCSISQLQEAEDGQKVAVGGLVVAVKRVLTRGGEQMAFVAIEDMVSRVEVLLFPKTLERCRDLAQEDRVVVVTGRVSWKEEDVTIVADDVTDLTEAGPPKLGRAKGGNGQRPRPSSSRPAADGPTEVAAAAATRLLLELGGGPSGSLLEGVRAVLQSHPGQIPVYLRLAPGNRAVLTDQRFWVSPSDALLRSLEGILGAGNVALR